MGKIFILLCLGLLGCTTVAKESKVSSGYIGEPTIVNEAEMDEVIAVFSEAIRKDSNYAGAYYNRAVAYFYKKNYEQCWKDVHAAEALGSKFSAEFIKSLKKASNREK